MACIQNKVKIIQNNLIAILCVIMSFTNEEIIFVTLDLTDLNEFSCY